VKLDRGEPEKDYDATVLSSINRLSEKCEDKEKSQIRNSSAIESI